MMKDREYMENSRHLTEEIIVLISFILFKKPVQHYLSNRLLRKPHEQFLSNVHSIYTRSFASIKILIPSRMINICYFLNGTLSECGYRSQRVNQWRKVEDKSFAITAVNHSELSSGQHYPNFGRLAILSAVKVRKSRGRFVRLIYPCL